MPGPLELEGIGNSPLTFYVKQYIIQSGNTSVVKEG